jgi:dipeptidyl aminopeptidase/acylaminoacyl peptidase
LVPDPLKPEDFADYHALSAVRISPDEKNVAFVVKQVDMQRDAYSSRLFVYQLDQGRTSQVGTSRDVAVFDWLPDGRGLVAGEWTSNGGQATRLLRIPLVGDAVEAVATVPGHAVRLVAVDAKRLLYAAKVNVADPAGQTPTDTDVAVADEVPFVRDGEGFTNKTRTHLHLHDLERQVTVDLTPDHTDVEGFDVWGDAVILTANTFEHVASVYNAIYNLALGDGRLQRLTDAAFMYEGVRFLSEDLVVVLGSDLLAYGSRQNKHAYALHLSDLRFEDLTPGWDKSLRRGAVSTDIRLSAPTFARVAGDNPRCSSADGRYYCVATEGTNSYLYAIGPGAEVERLVDAHGSVDDFDVRGTTLAYVALRGAQLQELYTLARGSERQLTQLNRAIVADKTLSTSQHFRVAAPAGDAEIDAWVMKPMHVESGKRHPAILHIHGGPKAAFSPVYQHAHQVLANAGYAVIFANPHGSDGRGNEFHASIRGNFGLADYDDLMAVVDSALAQFDFIDPARLGVTGVSYGGFMTNWIVGHNDRFRAAVSVVGVSDFISHFGTSEIGYYWDEDYLTVPLWDNVDKWWFHSPLRYADRVKTPTLFLHSDQCYECGLPQSQEMYTALKRFGVETRLCIFKGGAHGFMNSGKPSHRLRYWDELLSWFDKYLKDDL